MRRNRRTAWSRALVRENTLTAHDLIWPVFVIEGQNRTEAVASMPGVTRYSVDLLVDKVKEAADLGIPAVALFPNTPRELRTADAREAFNADNLVCQAVRAIRKAVPEIGIMCDVALDPYTSHGHDGLMEGDHILNDATLEALVQQIAVQAEAGCDIIAPSDMMDGRIGRIRAALEAKGLQHVQIMAYSAKYASGFYGPFRDAVGSSGTLTGDKRTYQMDPANTDEAIREVALDIAEGADMVMVKPGMPYLDIVRAREGDLQGADLRLSGVGRIRDDHGRQPQWLARPKKVILEALMSFKRAGADGVLTYFAVEVAKGLKG